MAVCSLTFQEVIYLLKLEELVIDLHTLIQLNLTKAIR
jgi:hypothetical protein